MDDDEVFFHLDSIDDFDMDIAFFYHHCTSDDDTGLGEALLSHQG
jgi:hypothetical protein